MHDCSGGRWRLAVLRPRRCEHANATGGDRPGPGSRGRPGTEVDLLYDVHRRRDGVQHDACRLRRLRVHRLVRWCRVCPGRNDRPYRLAAQTGRAQPGLRRRDRRRGRGRWLCRGVSRGRVRRSVRDRAQPLDRSGGLEERAVCAAAHEFRASGGLLYEFQPGPGKRFHRRRLFAAGGRPHGDGRILTDKRQGYAGGGLWSTPAYDPATNYLYWGAGNPNNKSLQYPTTDAILKIDVNPARPTFGQIVASYPGNVDQYTAALQALGETPACELSAGLPDPLDDPVCGQLDLDFGAAANLFTISDGTKVVGELQKSGVYHVANASTMQPAWATIVGPSCFACNAASTAFDGSSIEGVSTPGGTMFSLDRSTGTANWLSPVGDGTHYQSSSTADAVVWTVDGASNLDGFATANGQPLVRRPLSVDAGAPVTNLTSSGIAIAENRLFVAAGGASYASATGYVIAYATG